MRIRESLARLNADGWNISTKTRAQHMQFTHLSTLAVYVNKLAPMLLFLDKQHQHRAQADNNGAIMPAGSTSWL